MIPFFLFRPFFVISRMNKSVMLVFFALLLGSFTCVAGIKTGGSIGWYNVFTTLQLSKKSAFMPSTNGGGFIPLLIRNRVC